MVKPWVVMYPMYKRSLGTWACIWFIYQYLTLRWSVN